MFPNNSEKNALDNLNNESVSELHDCDDNKRMY